MFNFKKTILTLTLAGTIFASTDVNAISWNTFSLTSIKENANKAKEKVTSIATTAWNCNQNKIIRTVGTGLPAIYLFTKFASSNTGKAIGNLLGSTTAATANGLGSALSTSSNALISACTSNSGKITIAIAALLFFNRSLFSAAAEPAHE
ncbi:TPA: hypothetical protein DEO28_00995 [Candidatus Dependentiae bacterium]|nr:MAG: hypothetical protein UR14_C0003G0049 [candidate division TM6 bacterium GW2011_GWE2_31_21]KKP54169.1 MAG: hypothetical protein UR43_C0001G0187 [candidate division TM6 bacterium GW2011_GWF2_33_332]HBS47891.1 hypothetical protein [Candidatus Dependentiae bacterium]HBZ73076.1 hypothetical protein [Candidatus Dependentiae bacterium]